MNDVYEDLSKQLQGIAKHFYEVAEHYYAISREKPSTSPLKDVAQEYRIAGESFLAALSNCERHLTSLEQTEKIEEELKEIRARQHYNSNHN